MYAKHFQKYNFNDVFALHFLLSTTFSLFIFFNSYKYSKHSSKK